MCSAPKAPKITSTPPPPAPAQSAASQYQAAPITPAEKRGDLTSTKRMGIGRLRIPLKRSTGPSLNIPRN